MPKKKPAAALPLIGIDPRFLRYLSPYGGLLALSALLIFIVAALDTLAPWPIKFIVDHVIGGRRFTGTLDQQVMGWLTDTLGSDQRVLAAVLGWACLA